MSSHVVLIDAHVHVHSVANAQRLLAAAAENFGRIARQLNSERTRWQGMLLLAEMAGVDWFGSMQAMAGQSVLGGWRVNAVPGEAVSLRLSNDSGVEIFVVAGRQIVTAEGIEVLALGTRGMFPDREPLRSTLDALQHAGTLTVLPWGVGKWLGRRGRLVSTMLARATEWGLHAGDNAGRPVFWPRPGQFGLAESQGFAVLPGTDPLPLVDEERQVGRFGFWTDGPLPAGAPMATLRSILARKEPGLVRPYGRQESLWRFVRNQSALRIKK